jgi:hypothetical protein
MLKKLLFAYLASNFQPNGTIEIARASDSTRENRRGGRTSHTRPATGVG